MKIGKLNLAYWLRHTFLVVERYVQKRTLMRKGFFIIDITKYPLALTVLAETPIILSNTQSYESDK